MNRSLLLLGLALGAGLWLACEPAAHATNVLSNLGQETDGTQGIDYGENGWTGQSFVTSSSDLTLNSVTLEFANASQSEAAEFLPAALPAGDVLYPLVVSIYNSIVNGPSMEPGSDILDLTAGNDYPLSAGSYVYTAPGGLVLAPNTEYWIVASTQTLATTGTDYQWDYTNSTSVDNPDDPSVDATSGWALDLFNTYAITTDQGGTWTTNSGFPQQFEISATPVPEPATWSMAAGGAVLLFGATSAFRRRA